MTAKRFGLLLTVVGAMLLACAGAAQAADESRVATKSTSSRSSQTAEKNHAMPNRYIVVLREDVEDPATVAKELSRKPGLKVIRVYDSALNGFVARIPARSVSAVRSDPRVDLVEKDHKIRLTDPMRSTRQTGG